MGLTLRVQPHRVQEDFLCSEAMIRLFVGGIGSGKTFAGVLALLTQPAGTVSMVCAPTYRVLKDATLPAFMAIAQSFVREHRKSDMVTTLHNGHRILWRTAVEPDRLRGPNLGFIYIDEAASIQTSEVFNVLIGRLRLAPGKMILTTTPKGQNWVYDLASGDDAEVFRCSTRDNVHLPDHFYDFVRKQYTSELARQELDGDFVDFSGGLFKREWWRVVGRGQIPPGLRWHRFWDLAVSTKRSADFTATARVAVDGTGRVWVADMWQRKASWPVVKKKLIEFATVERDTVSVGIETVSGFEIAYAELLEERALGGVSLRSVKPGRDKTARAAPLAARAEAGRVNLVRNAFTDLFIGQASLFPNSQHDDLIDAVAGALALTTGTKSIKIDKTNRLAQRATPW
mgnify:FL=1